MSQTSKSIRLAESAQRVLTHLSRATNRRDRTLSALKEDCGLAGKNTEAGLQELILAGLVEQDGDSYVLTDAGCQFTHKKGDKPTTVNKYIGSQNNITQNLGSIRDSSVTVQGVRDSVAKPADGKPDVTATPLGSDSLYHVSRAGEVVIKETMQSDTLPYLSAQAHPVRANSAPPVQASAGRRREPLVVRFLLAFTSLRDGLPIPIFDQDKMGRLKENQIAIGHDQFLSGTHCRFLVKKSKTGSGYECFVEDLSSRNGLTVNSTPIEPNKPVQLKHGTKLTIGGMSFVVIEIPS
jgi:hypothetical protein